jgi:hypothetical protein
VKDKRTLDMHVSVPFTAIAERLNPAWGFVAWEQSIIDLVDEMDNPSALFIMASECVRKLSEKYKAEEKLYTEKALVRTFDGSDVNSSALRSFTTRAENGRNKAKALKNIRKMINLVQSGKQDKVNGVDV